MGLGAGIIAGAMQGVGDGMQQVADQKAKLWGQEEINQQMSDLAVQRQAALSALQFLQQQRAYQAQYGNSQPPAAAATPAARDTTAPVGGGVATGYYSVPLAVSSMTPQPPAQSPVPSSSTPASSDYANHPGLDPTQHSPEVLAYLQKTYPEAYANGVNHFSQWQQAGVTSASAASGTPVTAQSSAPGIYLPSPELARAAMNFDRIVPGGGAKLIEMNGPDPVGRALLAQGIAPGSKAWHDAYAAHQFKENSENVRPGGTIMVGGKPVFAAPSDGVQTTFDDAGHPTANLVPGYAGAKATMAATNLAATNTQTLAPTDRSQVDANGRVIPTSIAGALNLGQSGTSVGLAPGQSTAADASQKELSDKWTVLNGQNQSAQSTISMLQNIKTQAQKAAVGPMSDRIDFVNGLVSLLPGDHPKAVDAVTANDLMDKFSNQLVAKLGQGGLGTDAARAIVAAGNPNSHMNLPAINEAVDNLVGATQQFQAKARLLSPIAARRDPVAYQNAEVAFDKVADPRIFQWKNIQNPLQQAAFLRGVAKQDPGILTKIHELQAMGALQ